MLTETVAPAHVVAKSVRSGLVLAALGVVFGDIGTSPLYSIQTLFYLAGPHPVSMGQLHVYGVVNFSLPPDQTAIVGARIEL